MPNIQNLNWTSEHCRKASLKRWEKHKVPIEQRFWSKVKKGSSSECWPWQAHCNVWGYGVFRCGKKTKIATRVLYELINGPFDPKLRVCHTCDNPSCCNPKHLFLGTDLDNCRDKMMKNRGKWLVGDQHPNTKYSSALVEKIRQAYVPWKVTGKTLAERFNIPLRAIYTCLYRERLHKRL